MFASGLRFRLPAPTSRSPRATTAFHAIRRCGGAESGAWATAASTSIGSADDGGSSSAAARVGVGARSAWVTGRGNNSNPGGWSGASSRSDRSSASSPARPRAPLVKRRRAQRAAPHCRSRGCTSPFRTAPTPSRARGRNGTRRRAARRHPTPARPQQSRHHLYLPAGHRQRRDHRNRPRTTRADDPRQHGHVALTPATRRESLSRKAAGLRTVASGEPCPIRACGARWTKWTKSV